VERQPSAIELGRSLLGEPAGTWRHGSAAAADLAGSDVVVAGYLLGELGAGERPAVVDRLWTATGGALVLVEPGSRAGYRRLIEARTSLIESGARIVAPCPGDEPCPLRGAAWCHFLARLDRSPLQRRAKGAARSFEDEPFAYLVVARPALIADPRPRVVLGRPRHRPGVVELRVCDDGRIETVVRSRRDGERYRAARDLAWGDAIATPIEGDPTRG
jgi:ribosomal protein RSM22 (predicted rRNA methylase)